MSKQRDLERYRVRIERFDGLLATSAPSTILEQEGALIVRSLLSVAGPGVLGALGAMLVSMERELSGQCPLHPIGEDHAITENGMCAACNEAAQADDEDAMRVEQAQAQHSPDCAEDGTEEWASCDICKRVVPGCRVERGRAAGGIETYACNGCRERAEVDR